MHAADETGVTFVQQLQELSNALLLLPGSHGCSTALQWILYMVYHYKSIKCLIINEDNLMSATTSIQ